MPPLLRDRYLVLTATHACDLATGATVSIADLDRADRERTPAPAALIEVLEHGRDGEPRAIAATVNGGTTLAGMIDRIAGDAAARGYIPIAIDLYRRYSPLIGEEIRDRALALIAQEPQRVEAGLALLDASARSPRPHLLIVLRPAPRHRPAMVREARAAYAPPWRPRPAPVLPADVQQLLQRAERAGEFVAAGRHAAAERLLRDVASALGRRSAWTQASDVSILLGRLLLERGRPLDAVRVFTDAIAQAASADGDRAATTARVWLAIAHTDADQLTAAESICRALMVAGGLDAAMRLWVDAVLGRVLLWQERVSDAEALSFDCTDADALDAGIRTSVQATRIRLLLAANRLFDAGLLAGGLMDALRDGEALSRTVGLTAYLRVLVASGEMRSAAAVFQDIATAARAARAPLRLLRARMIWAEGLGRAGRQAEAEHQRRILARAAPVAPPLLRRALRRLVSSGPRPAVAGTAAHEMSPVMLVRAVQEEDEDDRAVARVLERTLRAVRATRVDLWSADAGPASIVQSLGTGLATTIGGRVLSAGIAIGPEPELPAELGVPIRLGARLIAALVLRWPADRRPPTEARDLLELVAAVAAPRVDGRLQRARLEAEASTLIPELVGVSDAIGGVRQAVARAAAAPFAVLVEGESGVGKELIARAVHYLSARRERRFCDVNCAALPDDLLESELFGHARGAFTGAVADRAGLFEEANGGTLFLDEVADLSPRAQAKLLRVVQQQEVRRVGETFARPVDVRLVAAANRDMRAEAASGHFRQDLLYRLDVIRIPVPPLRDRPEDIAVLAQHFWRSAADRVGTLATLSPGVLSALASHHWPGNVRELQNVVAALAVAAPRRGRVAADLLPAAITGATPIRSRTLADARQQFERRFVEVALAQAGGNRARAARTLGVTRQGLLKLMSRLRVEEK